MKMENLEQKLSQLGFPFLEAQSQEFDVHKTLAQVVESHEARYWEALPVLLANASQRTDFDLNKVSRWLTDEKSKEYWRALLLLSASLCEHENVYFDWLKRWLDGLNAQDKEELKKLRNYFAQNENFHWADREFNAERLKNLFERYYQSPLKKNWLESQAKQDELSLEYYLSQLFSPKQKELLRKKLSGEKFTKTEREYFSRAVKKKVLALANPELHRLAQRLLE